MSINNITKSKWQTYHVPRSITLTFLSSIEYVVYWGRPVNLKQHKRHTKTANKTTLHWVTEIIKINAKEKHKLCENHLW